MPFNLELHNNSGNKTEVLDIRSYVTSHTEYVSYNKYTDPVSASIGYVESNTQTPQKNLLIDDFSWRHPKNNPNFLTEFKKSQKNFVFKSKYKELLITTVLSNNEPLYYKHKTRFDPNHEVYVSPAFKHGEELASDNIEDNGYVFADGWIYNNYQNKFHYDSGSYELRFVTGKKYNSEETVTELLSNVESVAEATWRDINPETGVIEVSGYTRNQIGDGFEFNVFVKRELCSSEENPIFIKLKDNNAIKILAPESLNQKSPWLVRIQNGFFYDDRKYSVSEYSEQNFNPEYGIIKMHDIESFFVGKEKNSAIIKLPIKRCRFDKIVGMHIDIVLVDESEMPIKALTSNKDKFGMQVRGTKNIVWVDGINSVDEQEAFVQLKEDLYQDGNESTKILATFFYEAEDYTYREIDFNPVNNPKILDHRYYFYLIPNKEPGERSVEWLMLDKEDIIQNCSEQRFKPTDYNNRDGDDIDQHLDHAYNNRDREIQPLLKRPLSEFRDNYCYGYQMLNDSDELEDNSNNYLEIGEVSLLETDYLDELFELDIRDKTPLNENNIENYFKRQWKGLQSVHGYGEEGQVYQNNNLLYVKVPLEMLIEYGGEYTEEELYELLKLKTTPGIEIIFDWSLKKPNLRVVPIPNVDDYRDRVNHYKQHGEWVRDIELEFIGLGNYKLYRDTKKSIDKETSLIEEWDLTTRSNDIKDNNNVFKYHDLSLEVETTYYYQLVYNEIYESDVVALKTMSKLKRKGL